MTVMSNISNHFDSCSLEMKLMIKVTTRVLSNHHDYRSLDQNKKRAKENRM